MGTLRTPVPWMASLTVPATPAAARLARATLRAALHDLDPDRLGGLMLALTEAVSNASRHAYVGEDGDICVRLKRSDGDVEVLVVDNGVGWETPTIDAGAGFGLGLMRATSSACEHSVTDGGGTTVRLRFAA